ncbi:MAG TPA: tRNA epoxyqueuosine(34) reductase QueG [Polyangiaceae bacterium]|nr:tRNA epoxyqueuosine(34) reductase QueG [Polyangiaceae bacterium]
MPTEFELQPLSEPRGEDGARVHHPVSSASPSNLSASELASRVRAAGQGLGFVRVGFASIDPLELDAARLSDWLRAGQHAEMDYLVDGPRHDPRQLLREAKTLIAVALAYPAGAGLVPLRRAESGPNLTGIVARYARGEDYHDVMRKKLRRLADTVANLLGRAVLARHCVDTAPLLERAAAERAGLGFAAKSTMTIIPGVGSYVMLGELLIDAEIAADAPMAARCGTCRLCLDACPTGAIVDAHVVDARRCISYLTIESSAPIPRDLRPLIGLRVFGCDVCQDVCPFNASAEGKPSAPELAPRSNLAAPDLIELLELGSARYRQLVKGTALRRTHRAQLARNAAIALGNSKDVRAVIPLARAVAAHTSGLVRGHAAWALGEIGAEAREHGLQVLTCASEHDPEAFVREEAALALLRLNGS